MAKSRRLEETLAELSRLRDDPTSNLAIDKLRKVLKGRSSLAVAKAAEIAGEFEIVQLVPELVAAFERFMINPTKTDMGCSAKTKIANALCRIGYDDEVIFLKGIRHFQMEPVWGGEADTAFDLRGACAMGLAQMGYPDVLNELAELLADPEPPARAAAAQAIALSGNAQGAPLLRLKVLTSDDDAIVISECLTALLVLAPTQSLSFVARLLDGPDPRINEVAAFALGESRQHGAFDILRRWWERAVTAELRSTGLTAIAMLRHDEALDFLLSLVSEAKTAVACDAVAALGIYRDEDALRQRVLQAAEKRDDLAVKKAIAKAF